MGQSDGGNYIHVPVMCREILGFLDNSIVKKDSIIVDCTVGEGGHSELFLKTFENINIIGFDKDSGILETTKDRLKVFGHRVILINDSFANISHYLDDARGRICAFLYDFGMSSYHLEKSGRGFSFKNEEPLDMRFDVTSDLDACKILNNYSERELTDIFFNLGEERWSKRVARRIIEARSKKPVKSSLELSDIVLRSIPGRRKNNRIHPATRIFQALRMAVNDELADIQKSLRESFDILNRGGRILAISFHSLEDRIVKNFFRRMARGCICNLEPRDCMCEGQPLVKILTKKPVAPGDEEIDENSRARSAKLRVCEKV